MKLIHKFKSPNFDRRKSNKIQFIIIHYTALKDVDEALNFLCSYNNKVSCHYLISNKGSIYNLVSEKNRAWHAGQSYWDSITDINSNSIGIELDFSPNYNNSFSKNMIFSLLKLLDIIKKKYKISNKNILAHSDIAPYRKVDPGKKFPWNELAKHNFSFSPKKNNKEFIILLRKWFSFHAFKSKKRIILFMLAYIGYDVSRSIYDFSCYKLLISNYRSHFFKKYSKNKNNKETYYFIENHFCTLLLTKEKK